MFWKYKYKYKGHQSTDGSKGTVVSTSVM